MSYYFSFNNTDLAKCTCYNNRTRDFCTDDPCHDYFQSMSSATIAAWFGFAFVMTLFLAYVISLCIGCCVRATVGPKFKLNKTLLAVTHYRMAFCSVGAVLVFIAVLFQHPGDDLQFAASAIVDEVDLFSDALESSRKGWEGGAETLLAEAHSAHHQQDAHRELKRSEKEVHAVKDILNTWEDGANDTGYAVRYLARSPAVAALFCSLVVATTIIAAHLDAHSCVPILATTIISLASFSVFLLQYWLVYGENFSSDICTDYKGMSSFASQYADSHLGAESPLLQASNQAQESAVTALYEMGCEGVTGSLSSACSSQFKCEECASGVGVAGMLAALQGRVNTSQIVGNAPDLGRCDANCSIAECAVLCRVGSDVQTLSAEVVRSLNDTETALRTMNTSLASLSDGSLVRQATDHLHYPLCELRGGFATAFPQVKTLLLVFGWVLLLAACFASLGSLIHGKWGWPQDTEGEKPEDQERLAGGAGAGYGTTPVQGVVYDAKQQSVARECVGEVVIQ